MDLHDSLLDEVRAAVAALAPGVRVDDDTPLIGERIIDSLSLLRLVSRLEAVFPISVRDGDLRPENFESIKAVCAFVEARLP